MQLYVIQILNSSPKWKNKNQYDLFTNINSNTTQLLLDEKYISIEKINYNDVWKVLCKNKINKLPNLLERFLIAS